jgi:hypothetical protein
LNNCCICGEPLPLDMTQLGICTVKKGIESVCLAHEFSDQLMDYIAENGGPDNIMRRLAELEETEAPNGD